MDVLPFPPLAVLQLLRTPGEGQGWVQVVMVTELLICQVVPSSLPPGSCRTAWTVPEVIPPLGILKPPSACPRLS